MSTGVLYVPLTRPGPWSVVTLSLIFPLFILQEFKIVSVEWYSLFYIIPQGEMFYILMCDGKVVNVRTSGRGRRSRAAISPAN